MTGIVFEGGTFRPIFSCGVMDALLSENILLPYCIGVSAGIADGVSYISKQPQRNLERLLCVLLRWSACSLQNPAF